MVIKNPARASGRVRIILLVPYFRPIRSDMQIPSFSSFAPINHYPTESWFVFNTSFMIGCLPLCRYSANTRGNYFVRTLSSIRHCQAEINEECGQYHSGRFYFHEDFVWPVLLWVDMRAQVQFFYVNTFLQGFERITSGLQANDANHWLTAAVTATTHSQCLI